MDYSYTQITINDRWTAYRTCDIPRYHLLKEIIKRKIKSAKTNWANRVSQDHAKIWDVVHDIQRSKCIDPVYKLYSDFNLETAANVLDNIFSTHFSPNDFDYSGHSHTCTCNSDDWSFTVTPCDVYVALSTCKASKAAGSDLIPTILYQSAAPFIAEPLPHFQLIHRNCYFS